jgi:hypothetical protein
VADKEQRALGHFLCSLEQQARIVGAHLVRERLAFLVVGIAHVLREHPGRRLGGFREAGSTQRDQRGNHQENLGWKVLHTACSRSDCFENCLARSANSRTNHERKYVHRYGDSIWAWHATFKSLGFPDADCATMFRI